VGNGEAGAAPAGPAVEQAGQTDQPGYPGEGGGLTDLAVSAFNDLAIGGAEESPDSFDFGEGSDSDLANTDEHFGEEGDGPLDGSGEDSSAGEEEGASEAEHVTEFSLQESWESETVDGGPDAVEGPGVGTTTAEAAGEGETQSYLRNLWEAGSEQGTPDPAEGPSAGLARTNGVEPGRGPVGASDTDRGATGKGSERKGRSFLRDLWDAGTAQDGKGPGGGGRDNPGPRGPNKPPERYKIKIGSSVGPATLNKYFSVGSPIRKDGGKNRRDPVFERMGKESDERLAKAQDERRAARDTWNRRAIQRDERQHAERWARLKALTK
jgi:hypothetical protein